MSHAIYAYVPQPDTILARMIDPRSGIVGRPDGHGRINLYYEGNRFGAENVRTYADRCAIAAGRLQENYPTIARSLVDLTNVRRIGTWTPFGVQLDGASGMNALTRWLGLGREDAAGLWLADHDALAAELQTGVRA
jgi:hypothetical protein